MIRNLFKSKSSPRKTKIICTIGPATSKDAVLKRMVKEGMDFARFNFSHGKLEEFQKWAKSIRKFARRERRRVEIIQDLQGPRIRLGKLPHEGRHINAGHHVTLVFGSGADTKRGEIVIQNDVEFSLNRGDKILMDKGLIELEVRRVVGRKVICQALTSGIIFSGKGVNLPNAESDTTITQKDF